MPLSPCVPSPCGANAICKESNNAGSCACLPDYIGNPYEGCRPECTIDSDCPSYQSCIRSRCGDPCPGACGQNADCTAINHSPTCTCSRGYTGDPFRFCSPMDTSKLIIVYHLLNTYPICNQNNQPELLAHSRIGQTQRAL